MSEKQGIFLEHLNWKEAESVMTEATVVVIPIGAQSKEHGYHLPLNNDFVLAEYLKHAIVKRLPVVIAPTINYSFYPAMVDYPGSASLSLETAKSVFIDISRSYARFGPERFYFLNTGISTIQPLQLAAEELSREGITLVYSDFRKLLKAVREEIEEQEGGSHADEIETSMMLFIAPEIVRMDKAIRDYSGDGSGPLSREPRAGAVHSPTGSWGDPTRATREKGEQLVQALIAGITGDITRMSVKTGRISKRN